MSPRGMIPRDVVTVPSTQPRCPSSTPAGLATTGPDDPPVPPKREGELRTLPPLGVSWPVWNELPVEFADSWRLPVAEAA